MRISDWSSDVCSSDLHGSARVFVNPAMSAIAPNIVPEPIIPRAIALSSIAWQAGTVIGPASYGFLFPHDRNRKGVVEGKSVSDRLDLGGRHIVNKTNTTKTTHKH